TVPLAAGWDSDPLPRPTGTRKGTGVSGPNTSYDPVEVTPLAAEGVETMVREALEAFTAATTSAQLNEARLAHTGDRSPLALANREIGALPPQARKDAGQRIGKARGQVNQALAARRDE